MSGTRRNTKRVYTQKDTRSFYLVANDVFYGLIFSSTQNFNFKKNRNLLTIPSFLFYDNQDKVIIDYSNSKNEDDLSYIKSFFNSLTPGITFTVEDALYVDDKSQINANLSGIFTFSSFEQGKIIKAEIVSSSRLPDTNDSYLSKFFTQVPQLFKSSSTLSSKQQKQNIVKNSLSGGIYSFNRMGIQIGDYIEFGGTEFNDDKKIKIIDMFIDADGFENLLVDEEIINENLIGQPILLNLFYAGDRESNPNLNDKTYGVCVSLSNTSCINVQNKFLCDEFSFKTNSQFQYKENTSCEQEIETISNVQRNIETVQERNLENLRIQQEITNQIRIVQNATGMSITSPISTSTTVNKITFKPKVFSKTLSLKISKNSFVIDEKETKEITVNKNTNLKFILDNPVLKSYDFNFSESENSLQEIVENVLKVNKPGFSNSYSSIYTGNVDKVIHFVSSDFKVKLKIVIK